MRLHTELMMELNSHSNSDQYVSIVAKLITWHTGRNYFSHFVKYAPYQKRFTEKLLISVRSAF